MVHKTLVIHLGFLIFARNVVFESLLLFFPLQLPGVFICCLLISKGDRSSVLAMGGLLNLSGLLNQSGLLDLSDISNDSHVGLSGAYTVTSVHAYDILLFRLLRLSGPQIPVIIGVVLFVCFIIRIRQRLGLGRCSLR